MDLERSTKQTTYITREDQDRKLAIFRSIFYQMVVQFRYGIVRLF